MTNNDSPNDTHNDTPDVKKLKPTIKDDVLEKLTSNSVAEQDHRLEERFLWIMAFFILLDFCLLGDMNTWAAPIVILIMELLLLIILARTLGVKDLARLIDKIVSVITKTKD